MRQPAAATALRSTVVYDRRMYCRVQQAMAEGDVKAATDSRRPEEVNMPAYRSAPRHLDEAFASLDIPELSAKAHSSMYTMSCGDGGEGL